MVTTFRLHLGSSFESLAARMQPCCLFGEIGAPSLRSWSTRWADGIAGRDAPLSEIADPPSDKTPRCAIVLAVRAPQHAIAQRFSALALRGRSLRCSGTAAIGGEAEESGTRSNRRD
jgi:hypothetical protein